MEEESPFEMDPNKLDGYPSVDVLPDLGWQQYDINSNVYQYVYGDFTHIGNILSAYGYPNYDTNDIINEDLPYTIPDNCKEYTYGDFTHIGNTLSAYGYPNYDTNDIINTDLPYTVPDDCKEYAYGDFTKIDSIISEIKYPIFDNALEYYETFGALYDTEVNKLVIPKTVTLIADYAFYRSNNIKKVKIASECLYYEHSFPEECEIEFYEEDE